MKRLLIGSLLVASSLGVFAQEKPVLTEIQQLKAQVFILKAEVAQLRSTLADREARLASASLTQEQAQLAEEFLKTAKAPAGSSWNWQKMEVSLPTVTPKK